RCGSIRSSASRPSPTSMLVVAGSNTGRRRPFFATSSNIFEPWSARLDSAPLSSSSLHPPDDDVLEDRERLVQVGAGVRRRTRHAIAKLVHGHRGIVDGREEQTLVVHLGRHLEQTATIGTDDDRQHLTRRVTKVQAQAEGLLAEVVGVLPEALTQAVVARSDLEGLGDPGDHDGRQGARKAVAVRIKAHVTERLAGPGDVAATVRE